MRSRVTFWLQLASLVATGWLLSTPLMTMRWPWYSVPWMLVQAAAFAAAACLAGGLITLILYVLMRQDPEYVLFAPLSTSTAAIWFAPAVILAAHRSPAAMVAALVLVINATRILYEQWGKSLRPAPDPAPSELFGSFQVEPPNHWRQLAPALAPSLCAQIGAAAMLLRHEVLAGLAMAMSAATMTILAQRSRAVEPNRPPTLPRSVLGLLLTLVLAIGLTVTGMMPRFGGHGFGIAGDGGTASAPAPVGVPAGNFPPERPRGNADSGFFGVILWPEIKPYATLIEPMPQTRGGLGTAMPARPMSIPFSGEYWMFRWPFAHPPQDSYFQRGNPADLSFSTTDHQPLQMEAHHKLDQSIATDCCGSIQVEVRNADRYPGTIALDLSLVDGRTPRKYQMWVGRAAVMSRPNISGDNVTAVRETLNFPMPATASIEAFDEFKLVFTRDRRRMDKSAKVAIERFMLVPRM